jgi:hypothetical protein
MGFERIFVGNELRCHLAIQLFSTGRANKYDMALAEESTEKRIRIGTKSYCGTLKLIAWLHRADRSGPSDIDGNQTCGVMIHKEHQ